MASNKSIPFRSDKRFLEEIKQIQLGRIKLGKDNPLKPVTPRRITLAMTRHKLFPEIKKDIMGADLK